MEQPTKAALRTGARALLATLPVEARVLASSEICRRILALPEWINARAVGLFSAQSTEPDLSSLLSASNKTFCFPRVSGDALNSPMRFR